MNYIQKLVILFSMAGIACMGNVFAAMDGYQRQALAGQPSLEQSKLNCDTAIAGLRAEGGATKDCLRNVFTKLASFTLAQGPGSDPIELVELEQNKIIALEKICKGTITEAEVNALLSEQDQITYRNDAATFFINSLREIARRIDDYNARNRVRDSLSQYISDIIEQLTIERAHNQVELGRLGKLVTDMNKKEKSTAFKNAWLKRLQIVGMVTVGLMVAGALGGLGYTFRVPLKDGFTAITKTQLGTAGAFVAGTVVAAAIAHRGRGIIKSVANGVWTGIKFLYKAV